MKLLAPNGKPSNLTAEQYKLVRTSAFKNWFGDWINSPETASKVVDENGEPLVCYHGTEKGNIIEEFYKRGNAGIHFGTKKSAIERRVQTDFDFEEEYNLIPVFLCIKTPIKTNKDFNWEWEGMEFDDEDFNLEEDTENNLFESYMHQKGYNIYAENGLKSLEELLRENELDGVFYKNLIEDKGSVSYVVTEPTQIKLADGTNTTFDVNNPDIRYNAGGEIKLSVSVADQKQSDDLYELLKSTELGSTGEARLVLLENNKVIGGIFLDKYALPYEYMFDIYIKKSKRGKGYSKLLLDSMIKDFIDNFPEADQIRGWVINKKLETYLEENYNFGCDDGNEENIMYCYLLRRDAEKLKFESGGNIIIQSEEGQEDRTEISIKGIGSVTLVETFPEYEFLDDIDEDTLEELGISQGDLIGKIEDIRIEDKYKGKGYAKILMKKAIDVAKEKGLMPLYLNASPMGSRGLNINDLTGFYESFGFEVFLRQGGNNLMILKNYQKGGRTIAQTPAPKKDRVYGSKKNKPKSAESSSKASSIILNPKTISSIKSKIEIHNDKFPKKKIPLSTAKAVVRRGMGAYSSSHRPTIRGGKPNSRVAWGLARLNAFIYKIQKGYSKSGKYTQDDDLINELGYRVKKYESGGELNGFEHTLKQVYPNIFLLQMDSQSDLANTFARCQAFYEWDAFKGNKFNIQEFHDWYAKNHPDLKPYQEEFYGFNLPSDAIDNCYKVNDERNEYDNFFLQIIEKIKQTTDRFYLIGVVYGDDRTLDHELAHAFFWEDENYKNDMTNLVNAIPNKDELLRILNEERGYGKAVLIDEAQAFLSAGLIVNISDWENYRKPFIERFERQKNSYSKGGSVLLAPNGKTSNLTSEQYKIVRTPEFKAWFGDWEKAYETENYDNVSKVIDEQTKEPLVVYHGSKKKFNVFKFTQKRDKGFLGAGFYFTNSKKMAQMYAQYRFVYEVFLNIKNPLIVKELKSDIIKKNNSDGVIYCSEELLKLDKEELYCEYVVFDSNQIKLADGTNTTFDGNNPDIRYESGGEISYDDTKVVVKLIGEGGEEEFKDLWSDNIIPKNPFYAWLYSDIKAEEKINSKEYDIAELKSALGLFWKKDSKNYKGGDKLVALLKGRISDDGKKIYILSMTTNPVYRRKGAMSYLIRKVRDYFKIEKENVYFVGLTDKGEKFYNKQKFNEGGATEPKKVYVSIRIPKETGKVSEKEFYRYEVKSYNTKPFEELQNQKMLGIRGVSTSNWNINQWLVHRDCLIVMPFKEFVELNNEEQIQYDDANYLTKNGLEIFYRLYDHKVDLVQTTIIKYDDYEGILGKIFPKISLEFALESKVKTGSKSASLDTMRLLFDVYYSGAFKRWIAKQKRINTVSNFTDLTYEYLDSDDFNSNYYSWKIDKDSITKEDLYQPIERGILYSAGIYKNESEWVLKDKTLNIPTGSQLFFVIGGYENTKEKLMEMIKGYGLDKIYKINFINQKNLDRLQSKRFSDESNIYKEQFESSKRGVEKQLERLYLKSMNEIVEDLSKKWIDELNNSSINGFHDDTSNDQKKIEELPEFVKIHDEVLSRFIEMYQAELPNFIKYKSKYLISQLLESFRNWIKDYRREKELTYDPTISNFYNYLGVYDLLSPLNSILLDYDYNEISKKIKEQAGANLYRYYKEDEILLKKGGQL